MKSRVSKNLLLLARAGSLITAAGVVAFNSTCSLGMSERNTPIVQAIQKAESAVVNIQGNKTITNANASGQSTRQEVNGMGTGVIIDRRGYIVTNYHVVDDVARIEVTLADGSTAIAKLINYDPQTDLALIKIKTDRDLPVIRVGTSESLLRGETVIAIGNPFGYQNSVTVGIISALHRDIPVNGSQQYNDLIQTNADINPGNSGGPLLNIDGEVIGINVAVRVGAQGIGFAIPMDTAMEVMADLVADHRSASHGITFSKPSDHRNSEYSANQLIVRDFRGTDSNSSREIRNGDRIDTIEGQPVSNRLELELAMLERNGQTIELGLERNGTRLAHSIRLNESSSKQEFDVTRAAWDQLGVRLSEVPASAIAGVGEEYKGGLKITEVRSGSPADRARLQQGDIIVGVMDWQTPMMKSLAWILANSNFKSAGSSKYYLVRKRTKLTVALTPVTGPSSDHSTSSQSAVSRNVSRDIR
jgi:serine protease Do